MRITALIMKGALDYNLDIVINMIANIFIVSVLNAIYLSNYKGENCLQNYQVECKCHSPDNIKRR